jgi:drug/metabolite transporter (DMT)-like permease
LVTLLWSTAGVVTRQLDTTASFEVTFWRSLFNALTLVAILAILRGPLLWRSLLTSPVVVWISGVCWAVMFTAFMVAITMTTVANVLVTMAIGPLLTALMSRFFLHHRLPLRTWIAIFTAGAGIVWMYGTQVGAGVSFSGSLVALAVPLAAATNFTILQHIGHENSSNVMMINPEQPQDMLLAVLIGAIISSAVCLPLAWPLHTSTHDLQWLALLGATQLALPCLLMVRLTRVLAAAEISLLGLLEVIFGVTWTWLGAGEMPTQNTMIGGALVLSALLGNELIALRMGNKNRLEDGVPSAPTGELR